MRRLPTQAVLPFDGKAKVLNRQLKERTLGQKVRRGPGRPKGNSGRVPHVVRPTLAKQSALHITLKATKRVPNLRSRKRFNVIKQAFVKFCGASAQTGQAPKGFRLVHFAVLGDHVHFVVEADSKRDLSLGMRKLLQSISRRLNAQSVQAQGGRVSTKGGSYQKLAGWLGRIFADRYHAHLLKTPTEMVTAVRYVLHNARRHFGQTANAQPLADPFCSAHPDAGYHAERATLAAPSGYLLRRACSKQGAG